MPRAAGAAATTAKPLPSSALPQPVDYAALGAAALVEALCSGDLDAQRAATAQVTEMFETLSTSDSAVNELRSCGVVPALVALIQPEIVDTCTTAALEAFWAYLSNDKSPFLELELTAYHLDSIWAVACHFSEEVGTGYEAGLAIEVLDKHLDVFERQADAWEFSVRHGPDLQVLLSKLTSFASDFVSGLLDFVTVLANAPGMRVTLATAESLQGMSACLVKYHTERKPEICVTIMQLMLRAITTTTLRDDYMEIRSCGVLAAVVPWMASASAAFLRDHGNARLYDVAANAATQLVSAVYQLSPGDSRRRIADMLCMQPGALAGVFYRITSDSIAGDTPEFVHDVLTKDLRPEVCLLDSHFLLCHLARAALTLSFCNVLEDLLIEQLDDECMVALATPMPHQRLPAAASAGVLSCAAPGARRVFVDGDCIELVIDGLVAAARGNLVNGCAPEFSKAALFQSLATAVSAAKLSPAVHDDATTRSGGGANATAHAGAPQLKRPRFAGTLTAADVNLQRRDSTVFVVAGRPFYAAGIMMEKCSAVIADALRDAPAEASVTVPMPADVPVASHYELFGAAVEHAYTGEVAATLACDSLFDLWCVGDYLCMKELCGWCCERLVGALHAADPEDKRIKTLRSIWNRAFERRAVQLCDACATAFLHAFRTAVSDELDDALPALLAEIEDAAPPDCKPSAHVARVLRDALTLTLTLEDDEAA